MAVLDHDHGYALHGERHGGACAKFLLFWLAFFAVVGIANYLVALIF